MPIETVTAERIRGQVFLLRDQQGFPIVMANPGACWGRTYCP